MMLLRKFAALSLADRRLVVIAASLLIGVRIGLLVMSTQRLRHALALVIAAGRGRAVFSPPNLCPSRVPWAVKTAARYGLSTCLANALVTQTLLEMGGEPATLLIGVKYGAKGAFEAHASVEHRGRVIMGESTTDYQTLTRWSQMRPSSPISTATSG